MSLQTERPAPTPCARHQNRSIPSRGGAVQHSPPRHLAFTVPRAHRAPSSSSHRPPGRVASTTKAVNDGLPISNPISNLTTERARRRRHVTLATVGYLTAERACRRRHVITSLRAHFFNARASTIELDAAFPSPSRSLGALNHCVISTKLPDR
jgi:hypothetical protein